MTRIVQSSGICMNPACLCLSGFKNITIREGRFLAYKSEQFSGSGTFSKGAHPPERKHFSAHTKIEVMSSPKEVLLPLQQHIGAPCEPVVKPKQEVAFGELIGQSPAFISAKLHAPIAGKIMKMSVTTLPNGRHMQAIRIKANDDQMEGDALWQDIFGGEFTKDVKGKYDPAEVTRAINNAGIVGLGGAAFPTHVKVVSNEKKPVDMLLVNGCECEPYLTSDDRLMREVPEAIVSGALLAGHSIGTKEIFINIEENKPDAIEAMRRAAADTGIIIAILKTKYPQGSERQMIQAVTKRIVPLGGLPSDVGVAVNNVGTMAAVARAVIHGKPLTHRVVCVTGAGIANPKNVLAPIGITYRELIDYCGGFTKEAARLLSGGPMMGFSFTNLDMPITKGTSGITILTHDDVKRETETSCLRCGRCVDVCPMNLVPARLAQGAKHSNIAMMERYNIMGCMECGCCSYICPANIPLVQLVRVGKAMLIGSQKK